MSHVLLWIIVFLIIAMGLDLIAIAIAIRWKIRSVTAAGLLSLLDFLPFTIGVISGGYDFGVSIGYFVILLHVIGIVLVVRWGISRLVAIHSFATFFFGIHLFLLVNAP